MPRPASKEAAAAMLRAAQAKKRAGMGLSIHELCLLAGFCRTSGQNLKARGLPVIAGKVFWPDFTIWRRAQAAPSTDRMPKIPKVLKAVLSDA
jgi:hypothetical protein